MTKSPPTPSESIECRSCGYVGGIDTYKPSMSIYQDCRCPSCGSTNNEHNSRYQERLFKATRGDRPTASPYDLSGNPTKDYPGE